MNDATNPHTELIITFKPRHSMRLIVMGTPIVKKNNQKVSFRGGKPRKYNTDAYTTWHDMAMKQIERISLGTYNRAFRPSKKLGAKVKATYETPVNLQCIFYMPDLRIVDLSALYEGIQDLLVEVGILDDDNWKIVASHDGSRVKLDRAYPRIDVTITDADIS